MQDFAPRLPRCGDNVLRSDEQTSLVLIIRHVQDIAEPI